MCPQPNILPTDEDITKIRITIANEMRTNFKKRNERKNKTEIRT